MIFRVALGLGLFLGSMTFGWWLGRRGVLTEQRAARVIRWEVMTLTPLVLCLLFWRMDLRRGDLWLLPLLGVAVSVSSLLPGWLYARQARLPRAQTGSFLSCAVFSNVGYLAAFAIFAVWGEGAYALCALYFMLFGPTFYTLGFWLAHRFGQGEHESGLGQAYRAELRWYPFAGMAVGALLSLARIPRPELFGPVNHLLIPLDTGLYLIAIGSQVRLEFSRRFLRPCLAMGAIKFIYAPLVALALMELFNVRGLARTVVLLEAAAPVGVSPLMLPLLFGLDRRLTNALWVSTTLWALPYLAILLPILWRMHL